MEKLVCKICGKEFNYKSLRNCRAQFRIHLKIHNITLEDYIVKYELDGIHPTCACGCGEKVHLKTNSWEFNTYAADSHVGRALSREGEVIKQQMLEARKVTWDTERYYKNKYDESIVKASAEDFLSKLYSLSELSEKYNIDKRTLQKIWFAFKLVSIEQYKEVTDYFKYKVSTEKRIEQYEVPEDVYAWAFLFIKEHPKKYTVNSIIKEYNKNRVNKEEIHPFVFYNQLKRKYGDEIDLYFAKGIHSSDEYRFYDVLTFYFPKTYINLGFRLDNYLYDFNIGGKLLIEYDADGFYHSSEKQKIVDKDKEEKAHMSGYKFMRISKKELKDPNLINIIEKCLN